jgi:hypothetical protein
VQSVQERGVIHKKVAHDFPGETFRVLKEKEEKQYGDSAEQLYKRKSNRMILGALRHIGYRCKLKFQSLQIFVIIIFLNSKFREASWLNIKF